MWNSKYRTVAWLVIVLAVVFTLAPAVIILLASVSTRPNMAFPPEGFTLRWYQESFAQLTNFGDGLSIGQTEGGGAPLVLSLEIAVVSAALAGAVGVLASYAIGRFRFPGRAIVAHLVELPILFPALAFGVGFLIILNHLGVGMTFGRFVIANTLIVLPFVVRNVSASLAGLGNSCEEASRVLGAGSLRTFWKVTLPLLRPGLVAGVLLAFIVAFNEFTVVFFLYTPGQVPFSVWAYGKAELGSDTTLAATATIILAFNLVLAMILRRMGRGNSAAL